MIGRLIVAIVTTLLYELALIAVVLWGLPRLGIYIPIPGLVVLVLALGAVAIAPIERAARHWGRRWWLVCLVYDW